MIAVLVGCLIGPGLCIMAMAVGLVVTRNDIEGR